MQDSNDRPNKLSCRTAMTDLISCHAGQQWEVRHGPCVTRGSHSFTCHPHTDHSSVCTPQSQGNCPLTGTKLYCLVTEAHGCENDEAWRIPSCRITSCESCLNQLLLLHHNHIITSTNLPQLTSFPDFLNSLIFPDSPQIFQVYGFPA